MSHRLSQLQDNDDERVFNTIIVITDRRILNSQLQHTIQSYEKTRGLVETITEGSAQLEKALKQGKQIIVTTLQTFPYVLGNVGKLESKRFALVIDEAHSSQGGSLQQKVTKLLTTSGEDEDETHEDTLHQKWQQEDTLIISVSLHLLPLLKPKQSSYLAGKKRTEPLVLTAYIQ